MKKKYALLLFYLAAVLGLIGALGNTLTSIPAIREHFVLEPSTYWYNRLTAFMILGTTGLYYTALTTGVGAWLMASKDAGRIGSGKVVLIMSILPHIPSLIALPLLTPSDWPHMIIHILMIVLIVVGLLRFGK